MASATVAASRASTCTNRVSLGAISLPAGAKAGSTPHLLDEHLEHLPDREILDKASLEQRVVLTFDLDFGDLLAAGSRATPSVVLFRLRDQTPSSVMRALDQVLSHHQPALESGANLSVDGGRIRVRRLPIGESDPG